MLHKSFDLVLVVLLATFAAIASLLGPEDAAYRAILALLFVLILPGYAMTAALFPNKALRIEERLLCTLGLSITVTALGSLLLNWTPMGLRLAPWSALLGLSTLGASAVAFVRRRREPVIEALKIRSELPGSQLILFGLAALIAVFATTASISGAILQPTTPFTQFWILPAGGSSENGISLGLANHESTTTQYRVQVLSGNAVIQEWNSIWLKPGEEWETTLELTPLHLQPADISTSEPVNALLYRASEPGIIYRQVSLQRSKD